MRTIVFSHGFGVKKDDNGLFTDIASALGTAYEYVFFDYNDINEAEHTITVPPFSTQVRRLQAATKGIQHYTLICHSQGCIIGALAELRGVENVILLAPPLELDIERLIEDFSSRDEVKIDQAGVSTLTRRDGTTTQVTAEFWKELKTTEPPTLYSALAEKVDVVIINAGNDEVLGEQDLRLLNDSNIVVHTIPAANHSFSGQARKDLISKIESATDFG